MSDADTLCGAVQEEPQSKRQCAPDEPAQGAAEVSIDGADLLSTQVCAKNWGVLGICVALYVARRKT